MPEDIFKALNQAIINYGQYAKPSLGWHNRVLPASMYRYAKFSTTVYIQPFFCENHLVDRGKPPL